MTKTSCANPTIAGVAVPDSKFGRAITEFVRDTESDLLFNHSSRVFYFGAIAGRQRGLTFNSELLYAATMFHDIGLMSSYSSPDLRFEVDGANAARAFLLGWKIDPADIEKVWAAIALHTTPGVPEFMHPVIALTTAGVEMDVLGLTYDQYEDDVRNAVVEAFPRTPNFKEDIIQAFYEGIRQKPDTTFGNVKADVIADKEPHYHRGNFCSVIRGSHWKA
ncbi:HD domain-containing protein [Sphingomonas sp. LR60]|uniref:HD domain-containing protein n=1 Tax=Sphingomonas sp. LR60 TaxID=3050233 RepID=UPI002FE11A81